MFVRHVQPARSGRCGSLYLIGLTVVGLLYVLGTFLGIDGERRGDRRVAFHAMQTMLLCILAPTVISIFANGIPPVKSRIFLIGSALYVVILLLTALAAFVGVDVRLPMLAGLAEGGVKRLRPQLLLPGRALLDEPEPEVDPEFEEAASRLTLLTLPLMINLVAAVTAMIAAAIMAAAIALAGVAQGKLDPNWITVAFVVGAAVWLGGMVVIWRWRAAHPGRLWLTIPIWLIIYFVLFAGASTLREV